MYSQPIFSQDLMKDDLIPFQYEDGSSDLMVIESVEWLEDRIKAVGFALMAGVHAEAFSPFNTETEVWNV